MEEKQAIIDKLRQDITGWGGFRPPAPGEAKDFGLGPIERAFPNQIFPTGVLHEFISSRPEFTAAIGGFFSGILQT